MAIAMIPQATPQSALMRRALRRELTSMQVVRFLLEGGLLAITTTSMLVSTGLLASDEGADKWCTLAGWVVFSLLLWFLAARWRERWPRVVRVADLVLVNAATTLLAVELACLVWSRAWPSPLVWDEASVVSRLDACRQKPGSPWFGFPCNSGGYHDEEFFAAGDADCVVAVLADSFGLGVVPHAFNFTTVAERALTMRAGDRFERIALHNFGIASTGLAHYLHLVDHEIPGWAPRLVVICLFVGNDVLHHVPRYRQSRPSTLQGLLSFQIMGRALTWCEHSGTAARLATIGGGAPGAIPAWIVDPSLEPPMLTIEEHLRIEAERFAVLDATASATRRGLARVYEGLDYARERLGERLLVVMIPDEFQVDTELFGELLRTARTPAAIERELPQAAISAHCVARGIPVLDLLPPLRAAAAAGTRVYHLRDTHWNAAGNRVAGEAIAAFLAARLGV